MPKRVLLVANTKRQSIATILGDFRTWLARRATIVSEYEALGPVPEGMIEADLAIVLGGDGSLLGQARRLVDTGIPLLGVNLGHLGFLAEFDMSDLKQHADAIFSEGSQFGIHERIMIEARVFPAGADLADDAAACAGGVALNDCVITAGPPFRMLEMALELEGEVTPPVQGDGLIISTPIGSTAYSVSAGGPIVSPELDCLAITPMAVHTLAFRPIIVASTSHVVVTLLRANAGTTLVMDGQNFLPAQTGDRVLLRKYARKVRLVANPTGSYWRTLIHKMHWALPPRPY